MIVPTASLEQWYNTNIKVILYCIQENKIREQKGLRDICTYFAPIPPEATDETAIEETPIQLIHGTVEIE